MNEGNSIHSLLTTESLKIFFFLFPICITATTKVCCENQTYCMFRWITDDKHSLYFVKFKSSCAWEKSYGIYVRVTKKNKIERKYLFIFHLRQTLKRFSISSTLVLTTLCFVYFWFFFFYVMITFFFLTPKFLFSSYIFVQTLVLWLVFFLYSTHKYYWSVLLFTSLNCISIFIIVWI